MTKKKIEDFVLISDGARLDRSVPFSLCSDKGEALEIGCFESSVYSDGSDAKFEYLRLSDVVGLREVRIGDTTVYDHRFSGKILNINIKGKLRSGENKLTLCFEAAKDGGSYSGLFGKCELQRFSSALIDRVCVKQRFDGSSAILDISLDMLGGSDYVRAVATLVSPSGQIFYGGITRGRGSITVKDPLFWWPKNMGVQNLYKLTVNLYGETEIEDTAELNVGIRKISAAEGATLDIGGVSFLPMGAVVNKERRLDPRVSLVRERAFLNSAARAGMNALLIRNCDSLPGDSFFELCDAHGIAVIREILASDLENNEGELELLARAAYHPSLVLYRIIHDSGNAARLCEVVSHIAPSVATKVEDKPTVYPGFTSIPSDKALALSDGEKNLFSEKLEGFGRETILDMIGTASEKYPYAGGFEDFAYVSSLSAAYLTECEMVAARLARGDKPAIYDGLGDTERGLCHSGMDYMAAWRATQYAAAKFFAPIYLHAEYLGDGRVLFYISNERRQGFAGSVEYRIADASNKTILSGSEVCIAERLSSRLILEKDFADVILGHENEYYLECRLRDPLGVYSEKVTLFVPEKHFRFIPPKICSQIVGSDRRFSITLTSQAFARSVELSFKGVDAVFHDNYVDLTSASPVKISFTLTGGISTAEQLSSALEIRSIYDTKK